MILIAVSYAKIAASWSCDPLDELLYASLQYQVAGQVLVVHSESVEPRQPSSTIDTSKETKTVKAKKEEVTPAEDGADSRPQPEREETVQVKNEELSLTRNIESSEDEDVSEPRDGTDSTPPSDATLYCAGTSMVKERRIIDTK